jgi:hypothetical protein
VALAALAKGKLRKQAAPAAPGAARPLQRPSRVAGGAVAGAPGAPGARHRPPGRRVEEVLAPFAVARERLGDQHRGRQARPRRRSSPRSAPTWGVPHRWAPGRCGRAAARATTPTGGKRRSGTPTKGDRWLGEVLTWVRLGGRPHPPDLPGRAVLAVGPAHRQAGRPPARWATQVLVIAWHLLSNDCDDHHLGGDWVACRSDHDRRKTHLVSSSRRWATRSPCNPPPRLPQPGMLLTAPAASPAPPPRRRR